MSTEALLTTGSPHLRGKESVPRTMWGVVLALLPPAIAAVVFFGPFALYLTFGTAIAAVAFEYPFAKKSFNAKQPLGDGSAFVAGMILGLSLSPISSWWVPIVGAFFAIVVGKQLFGGIGSNVFNPAMVGRGFLLLVWPREITQWVLPFDGGTGATPLVSASGIEYLDLFVGNIGGSLGETSVIASLIGAAFLLWKGYIGWEITGAYIVSAALAALAFGMDPVYTVLAGSIIFAGVYIATDMVTSPASRNAKLWFGVGAGVLTVVIRRYTVYPGGVTFAILLMNGLSYVLETFAPIHRFGEVIKRKRNLRTLGTVGFGLAVFLVISGVGGVIGDNYEGKYLSVREEAQLHRYFPEADLLTPPETSDNIEMHEVYSDTEFLGNYAVGTANGYGGAMRIAAAFDTEGVLVGAHVIDHKETATIGPLAMGQDFIGNMLGFSFGEGSSALSEVDMISGATVSSRAVSGGIQRILDFYVEEGAEPGGPIFEGLEDGEYTGSAQGYQSTITVRVVVEGGKAVEIEVTDQGETPGIGDRAYEPLGQAVLDAQTTDVDVVSGATVTSQAMLAAIREAVGAGGGEVSFADVEDGTYTGVAQGYGGDIELELTFAGGELTAIDVLDHSETAGISDPAFEDVVPAIIEAQSPDVDAVSGATMTSDGIMSAVRAALPGGGGESDEAPAGPPEDGTYTGVGEGYGGPIEVEVQVQDGWIVDIQVLDHGETPGISDPGFEETMNEIYASNSTNVDTVSGATMTSQGVIDAVKDALAGGGAEVSGPVEDGTYTGVGEGYGGDIELEVVVQDGWIVDIQIVDHSETPGISDPGFEETLNAIFGSNSSDVDAVGGATMTSEGVKAAVRDAVGR
ncbi:MAG: RnfABCDGE type electron transport complex subunit D [Spirochaeta sp.]|nr:RnfABCDGE type electron transport complex subunit D [Spirochaeta sp.]